MPNFGAFKINQLQRSTKIVPKNAHQQRAAILIAHYVSAAKLRFTVFNEVCENGTVLVKMPHPDFR